jgi:hypothetical protein
VQALASKMPPALTSLTVKMHVVGGGEGGGGEGGGGLGGGGLQASVVKQVERKLR